MICKKEGLTSDDMNIVHNGQWLDDDARWWYMDVLDDDNIFLDLFKR